MKVGPQRSFAPTPPAAPKAAPADSVVLLGTETLEADQAQTLREVGQQAVDFFEEHFGDTKRPLTLDTDPEKSLRVGYSVDTDSVNFPRNKAGVRVGMESKDIITHESFHALLAQAYPEYNTDEMIRDRKTVRLHEGLADYFTYHIYPDQGFAEDRRGSGGKPLRHYSNSRRVSLSPGGHSQGNAITSYLVKHKIQPSQIREFLEGGEFSLEALGRLSPELQADLNKDAQMEMSHRVSGYPASKINKYRISANKPLRIDFTANDILQEEHPGLSVEWMTNSGLPSQYFTITADSENSYSIRPKTEDGVEKVLAVFKEGDELIGSRPFYFGTDF